MQLAERLGRIPPYLFTELREKTRRARAQGQDVISLAIGDPVDPTPEPVIDELCRTARDPANHRYPTDEEKGMLAFRSAVARWYAERYGVELDPQSEVLALIGSKEGCHHFALARVNPDDVVLMTDPGYPAYRASILFAGGEPVSVPIRAEHGFLPRLNEIPADLCQRATAIYLNYPNNPTGAVADIGFFERAAAFAREHELAVLHDGPYSEVAFDGYRPPSFLEAEGAREVGIEFHSLSKSYNMTGWRIGMAAGNAEIIDALTRVKSNLDSGIPQAIQRMAIAALEGPQGCIEEHNRVYQRRRDRLVAALRGMGLRVSPPKASLYVWARVPEGTTSVEFATRLLEEAGVVVTPGVGYGPSGEGYVRLSLTIPDERLEEGVRRLEGLAAG